jgi:hypothetical protein
VEAREATERSRRGSTPLPPRAAEQLVEKPFGLTELWSLVRAVDDAK